MSLAQKDVRDLISHIRATKSYKVTSSGKHHRVLDLKGRVVVDENGPIIISKTPSEHRWREMTVHRLMRAGVFKSDPYKQHHEKKAEANGKGDHLTKEETRQLQRESIARLGRNRADRTKRLREKLEPLVAAAGGWNDRRGSTRGVSPSELGQAAHHWGAERGRVDRPPSVGAATQAANVNLKKGGTLSERTADFWEAFVNEWAAAPDTRRWYIDMVRAAKGLPLTDVIETSLTAVNVPEDPVPEQTSSLATVVQHAMAAATSLPHGVGHRALKAVFLMAASGDKDRDEIMEMGEWILAREYEQSGE